MSVASTDVRALVETVGPVRQVGRQAIGAVGDLGAAALLMALAARSLIRPRGHAPGLLGATLRQCGWLFAAGFPIVALVLTGMGTFLAMQGYFGATFVEGTGAVVGVGLFRNVASLMTGFIMAGLLGFRVVADLRILSRIGLDAPPNTLVDREVLLGRRPDPRGPTDPGRIVLVRVLAAALAGPVLSLWGAVIGTLVGWQVACSLVGLSPSSFFLRFWEMIWTRDAVGLVVKGAAFGGVSALFACVSGLREPIDPRDLSAVHKGALRAICWSCLAILAINSGWFLAAYLSGKPFGPTLLNPPQPPG